MGNNLGKVGFGGGCHWCTEAVFQSVKGVLVVEQGFIASTAPNERYSEAVIVTYDTNAITLQSLVEAHLRTHASTSSHSMRSKYRSAVYCFSDSQLRETEKALDVLQKDFENNIVTRALQFVSFKESNERYKNYYQNNPERPFCKVYIDPKLEHIEMEHSHLFKKSSS